MRQGLLRGLDSFIGELLVLENCSMLVTQPRFLFPLFRQVRRVLTERKLFQCPPKCLREHEVHECYLEG